MLPPTLKYLYSVEPVRMHFPAKQPCTNDTVCNAATVSHFSSMLPPTLKYLYSVEPVRMHFPAKQLCTNDIVCNAACSIAHSIICTVRLFRGKMHSDWFNGIEILQGRWQHGEKLGYSSPSGLKKTLCKWHIYVPLVTKGLTEMLKKNPNYISIFISYLKENTTSFLYKDHSKKF